LIYEHEEKKLVLEPLKGTVEPSTSDFSVGKVKIEIRLAKTVESQGRWGKLVRDPSTDPGPVLSTLPAPDRPTEATGHGAKPKKNWDGITKDYLSTEKEKTSTEDPNAGGDGAVNGFFQKIFGDADDDTKRAMMKSYVESGGTTLSTNWDEVRKETVTVKPPEGSEWKSWG